MTAFDSPEKKSPLALALASGMTVVAAAERMHVSESTAHRYLKKPAFRRLVARLRGQMLEAALGRIERELERKQGYIP